MAYAWRFLPKEVPFQGLGISKSREASLVEVYGREEKSVIAVLKGPKKVKRL